MDITKPINVLLVEDDLVDAKIVRKNLAGGGPLRFEVHHVTRLSEALEHIKGKVGAVDVILLDLGLPDGQGLQTAARTIGAASSVPILALTGSCDPVLEGEIIRMGFQDFLPKEEMNAKNLARSIRYAIERQKLSSKLKETHADVVNLVVAMKRGEIDVLENTETPSRIIRLLDSKVVEEREKMLGDLKRANSELQQFAYATSHDLKEPLRTLKIYLQFVARNLDGKLDPETEKYFGFILKASERLEALVNSLLEIARLETRAKPFEPTNLEEIFQAAVDNLDGAIITHGAVVTHDPLPTVEGDPVQLLQLFQNLIGNALKFHDERPPEIHVHARQVADVWILSVHDQGIGVAVKQYDEIFVVFKRLHGRDEFSGGTGIGLALCKTIVERHGGRIWVVSKEGEGSNFQFSLPATGVES